MNIQSDDLCAFAIMGTCVAVIFHDLYQTARVNKALKKLGLTLSEVLERTDVEISDGVVRNAVEAAAKAEATKMVKVASEEAKAGVLSEMKDQIANTISSMYFSMQTDLEAEMKRQVKSVGPIELDKLKRMIVDEGKAEVKRKVESEISEAIDAAKDKLDDAVDDLQSSYEDKLEEMFSNFGDQLKTMKKVADSLNKSMLS